MYRRVSRFAARLSVIILSLIILGAVAMSSASAGSWTTVGGNTQRNGQADENGPMTPDVLWQGSQNALFGSQVYIDGGRLAAMRFQTLTVSPIVCHDLYSGAQLWSVDFPGTNSRSVPRGMRDGRVYATNFQETGNDSLIALDAETGNRLWVSEAFCERGIIWSVAYAPNGDILVPITGSDIARVDCSDGSIVWTAPRTIPNTGAECLCVYGDKVYGFEGSITTPKVLTAWDLETGARLYSSPALAGDGDQEVPFGIAPSGIIYVLRDGGNLHALIDDGSSITEAWNVPINAVPYSGHFGIGLDGSIYLPDGDVVVRLDPADGSRLDSTAPLVTTSTLNARFAIDADGTVYVGNGGYDDGGIFAFTPDLQPIWNEPIASVPQSGPALGPGGVLAIAGRSTNLKVYIGDPTAVPDMAASLALDLRCGPNPFTGSTQVRFALVGEGPVRLEVFDPAGRRVRSLLAGEAAAGPSSVLWDGRDDRGDAVEAGVYFLRLLSKGGQGQAKVLRVR